MRRTRTRSLRAVLLASVLGAGCQTSVVTSDGRPMPPAPRPAREVPGGVAPDRMVLLHAQKATDTDGNGFPDEIEVLCSLFADGYNASIACEGAFVFELYRMGEARRADAKPIATWRYEAPETRRAQVSASYGPCYRFDLSLIRGGGERLPPQHGDLRGWFEPVPDGERVAASDQVRPVQIGGGF